MSPGQRTALRDLAQVVKSNFKTMNEAQIINRIGLVSGRSFKQALTGYEMMQKEGFLTDSFVEQDTKGKLMAVISRSAGLCELIERFDALPVAIKASTPREAANGLYEPVRLRTIHEVLKTVRIADFAG
jgi:hypothetical protein